MAQQRESGAGPIRRELHVRSGARRRHGLARDPHKIDGGYLQQHEVDFSGSFILAGQIKGGQLRLFMVYDAGNFIEAMGDTTYFQIGEVKYGKPILDRIIQRDTSLSDAAKCALISFDSTMRSNVSVGPPLDLLIYRRNSLKKDFTIRLEDDECGFLKFDSAVLALAELGRFCHDGPPRPEA